MRLHYLLSFNARGQSVSDLEHLGVVLPTHGETTQLRDLATILEARVASLMRRDLPIYVKLTFGRGRLPEWQERIPFTRGWLGTADWEIANRRLLIHELLAKLSRFSAMVEKLTPWEDGL